MTLKEKYEEFKRDIYEFSHGPGHVAIALYSAVILSILIGVSAVADCRSAREIKESRLISRIDTNHNGRADASEVAEVYRRLNLPVQTTINGLTNQNIDDYLELKNNTNK